MNTVAGSVDAGKVPIMREQLTLFPWGQLEPIELTVPVSAPPFAEGTRTNDKMSGGRLSHTGTVSKNRVGRSLGI